MLALSEQSYETGIYVGRRLEAELLVEELRKAHDRWQALEAREQFLKGIRAAIRLVEGKSFEDVNAARKRLTL